MIRQIAVIGTGTMGRGIAYLAALAGYDTVIHDADPAATRRRGNRGDGVAAVAQRCALAFASAASVRLMYHCCTIDSRFCTTQ